MVHHPTSPGLAQEISDREHVVVVYHVSIVAIGHGLFKKFWPLVIGCVLRTAGVPLDETIQ